MSGAAVLGSGRGDDPQMPGVVTTYGRATRLRRCAGCNPGRHRHQSQPREVKRSGSRTPLTAAGPTAGSVRAPVFASADMGCHSLT
jgi:hypothetical protein